jgi:hypothetical protein
MKYLKSITIWENKRRLELLKKFSISMQQYFDNLRYNFGDQIENDKSAKARTEINKDLDEVYIIMIAAGIDPSITYSPPPATGVFYQKPLSLLHNFHNLSHYKVSPDWLMDFIVRTISTYSKDSTNALLRTLNPLFWVGRIFDYIVDLPFALIGRLGFNQRKVEASIIGRCIKGLLYLIVVFAALLTILYYLGYLEQFKDFIQKKLTVP